MKTKSPHLKRVKHFKTKVSKATIAIESQSPKKSSKKIDEDELDQEIVITIKSEEIITDDINEQNHPFFDFF